LKQEKENHQKDQKKQDVEQEEVKQKKEDFEVDPERSPHEADEASQEISHHLKLCGDYSLQRESLKTLDSCLWFID
jgi:hypothetical protein